MIMVDYDEDIFGDILAQLDDGLDDTLDTNDGNLSIFRLSAADVVPELESRPRINTANAASFQPPSLNGFRSATSRGLASEPARWYWQMAGEDWDGATRSYSLAVKKHRRLLSDHREREQHRRLLPEYRYREQQRERQRDRGDRVWAADANQRRQERRVKAKAAKAEAAKAEAAKAEAANADAEDAKAAAAEPYARASEQSDPGLPDYGVPLPRLRGGSLTGDEWRPRLRVATLGEWLLAERRPRRVAGIDGKLRTLRVATLGEWLLAERRPRRVAGIDGNRSRHIASLMGGSPAAPTGHELPKTRSRVPNDSPRALEAERLLAGVNAEIDELVKAAMAIKEAAEQKAAALIAEAEAKLARLSLANNQSKASAS